MATTIADITIGAATIQAEQILSVDIMFVEGVLSLIGLATPLDLTMVTTLNAYDSTHGPRSAIVVKKAIDSFIATLASRNFVTRLIMSDGEGAVGVIKDDLNMLGIEVDISGAGRHVARIERKIQTVKERIRAYIAHQLPFTLTSLGVAMLVLFCVSRLNYQVSEVGNFTESPRVLFLARQTDGKLDFRVGFGEYVQCTVPNTNNTMEARTEDCIAMVPTGSRTGSVKVMSISTGKILTRDHFRILPMPVSVINRLNEMAAAEGKKILLRTKMSRDVEGGLETMNKPSYIRLTPELTADTADSEPYNPIANAQYNDDERVEFEFDPSVVNDVRGYPEDSDLEIRKSVTFYDPADLDVGELQEFTAPEESSSTYRDASVPVSPPRSTNSYGNDVTEERALNITVKEALKSRGAEAVRVIKKELSQMLTKGVWTPVHLPALTKAERWSMIRSQMFLKEKFLPTGVF